VWCSAKQQAQQEGGSLLVSLASCLMECVYSLIDYLTKFATVRMAITGEAFLEAARRATDLLARNFLKASLTLSTSSTSSLLPRATLLIACTDLRVSLAWTTFFGLWSSSKHLLRLHGTDAKVSATQPCMQ